MVTKEKVLEVLKSLPADRKNAMESVQCTYTDIHGDHCIAGEVFTRFGTYCPANGSNDSFHLVDDLEAYGRLPEYDEEAIALLADAQTIADAQASWGEVVEILTTLDPASWDGIRRFLGIDNF